MPNPGANLGASELPMLGKWESSRGMAGFASLAAFPACISMGRVQIQQAVKALQHTRAFHLKRADAPTPQEFLRVRKISCLQATASPSQGSLAMISEPGHQSLTCGRCKSRCAASCCLAADSTLSCRGEDIMFAAPQGRKLGMQQCGQRPHVTSPLPLHTW